MALGTLLASSGVVRAQGGEPPSGRPLPIPMGRGARGRGADSLGPREQALARQVREAFARVVKRELALTDDQSRRLDGIDRRFQQQRNEVGRDERDTRLALQAALEPPSPDQTKVDQLLGRLVAAQHKRADILESEQKELSSFLTPVQRARFLGLREQLNRRVQMMRQEGGGRRGRGPGER